MVMHITNSESQGAHISRHDPQRESKRKQSSGNPARLMTRAQAIALGSAAAGTVLPLVGCASSGNIDQDTANFLDAIAGSQSGEITARSSRSSIDGKSSAASARANASGASASAKSNSAGSSSRDFAQASASISRDVSRAITDFSIGLVQAVFSMQDGSGTTGGSSAASGADDSSGTDASSAGAIMISPLSAAFALAMAANGAQGATLTQIEDALGLTLDDLNPALSSYMKLLASSGSVKANLANSAWANESLGFVFNDDYEQALSDWFGVTATVTAFDDGTADEINSWVSDETNGMIDRLVDEVPADAVLYLVNALAFEALWSTQYTTDDVSTDIFTCEDGTQRTVEFMYSTENRYLQDDQATGVIKSYTGGNYAFAALLPNEGVSVSDYLSSLTGERLQTLLTQAMDSPVSTAIPKFSSDFSTDLATALADLGITDAFDPNASDLSGIGTVDSGAGLYISRVLHATYVNVNETGTSAAAATSVEISFGSALTSGYSVTLNRPFIYAIVEMSTLTPLFIGVVSDLPDAGA